MVALLAAMASGLRESHLAGLAVLAVGASIPVTGWLHARTMLRLHYTAPFRRAWHTAEPPWAEAGPEVAADAATQETELQQLGYRRAGYLAPHEGARRASATVYIHRELPVYAILALETGRTGHRAVLQLETFWEGGGRLTTTASAAPRFVGGLERRAGVPRLVQRRPGGRPAALDGQHIGTLRAWMAGGRQPQPAARSALLPALAADHTLLARLGTQHGWLSLGDYLRLVLRRDFGTLRF